MLNLNNFYTNAEKLISFFSQDILSVVSLSKKQIEKIQKNVGNRVFDLIFNLTPEKYEKRPLVKNTFHLKHEESATIEGTVDSWKKGFGKRPFVMNLKLEKGNVLITFFGQIGKQYFAMFPVGSKVLISGQVSKKNIIPGFTNPSIFKYDETWKNLLSGIVPVYKKIKGVSHLFVLRTVSEVLFILQKFPYEWLPDEIIKKHNLPNLIKALCNLHFPSISLFEKEKDFFFSDIHKRIAFDKIFFFQYGAMLYKEEMKKNKNRIVKIRSKISLQTEKSLPFSLTNAQKRVLEEIRNDLKKNEPMSRLLQGDVGSGKTLIMLLSGLDVISSGYKTIIMAPTEILAKQHFTTIEKFISSKIKTLLVTGGITGKKRLEKLKNDLQQADFIVGTHALYEKIEFMENIGLIIIDEQHRFGVAQRMKLFEKAKNPDMLVVSATPIPRSLALTVYGGIDISVIDEMPPGRTPVKTRFVRAENRFKVVDYVVDIIKNENKKGYWVCPLVEESEKMNLKDVTTVFNELKELLGEKVLLLHGKMKSEEKNQIIEKLKTGKANLLVATVVIEVGVDIQDASFMVIENAERFGLAQLHQLRGRVGRGNVKSFAALIGGENLSEKAEKRLNFMVSTNNGFKIAEFDLKQRGPGALFGNEQSGLKNDPYFILVAKFGKQVETTKQLAKQIYISRDAKINNIFIKIFKKFFEEQFKRYKTG